MKIFLDVGSNKGQTIDKVLNPIFKVDLVYGFEPSPICCSILRKKFGTNSKIVILNFGLWRETRSMILHSEGTTGATVYSDYRSPHRGSGNERSCSFVRASDWFKKNLSFDDEVILKLNCEGSECDIVNDLIDSGEFKKLKVVLIDYDVRKSPSQKNKEGKLKKRFSELNITNVLAYEGSQRHELLKTVLEKGLG